MRGGSGRPVLPGPGRESVWDYPRPPAVRRDDRRVEVWFAGVKVANSRGAFRVLETSHPPVFYIPPGDVMPGCLEASGRESFCEFKGKAVYCNVGAGGLVAEDAAWFYPHPSTGFEIIAGCLAFYPGKMERCLVGGETVRPQPGGFYGGWITAVVGPFKGDPGTEGW